MSGTGASGGGSWTVAFLSAVGEEKAGIGNLLASGED